MVKVKEQKFTDSTIGLVTAGGTALNEREKGVTVILWKRENELKPCLAEVFSTNGENENNHAEIGLTFEGNNLIDYDGVYECPNEVLTMLRDAGYNTEEVE